MIIALVVIISSLKDIFFLHIEFSHTKCNSKLDFVLSWEIEKIIYFKQIRIILK